MLCLYLVLDVCGVEAGVCILQHSHDQITYQLTMWSLYVIYIMVNLYYIIATKKKNGMFTIKWIYILKQLDS